jgi:hypothetical protein
MAPRVKPEAALMAELRAFGLRFPEAHTKTPWPGHLDLAVKGKTFAFMSTDGEPFSLTCKLPDSSVAALMFPFASAAGYGLGKSGWVTARFEPGAGPPVEVRDVFKEWIEESYRATAPKKLVAALEAVRAGAPKSAPAKAKRAQEPQRSAAASGSSKSIKKKALRARKATPR